MLTHTDVHLLVGMLSLITSPTDVEVELGSRVFDEGSGTRRDVDVTITARHADGTVSGYAAVEVKDEAEPLGTQTVEQLAAKLCDMPSITRRSIVSSSGYTAPAKAKAARHGVDLLTLREWRPGERVYRFLSRDFVAEVETRLFGWVAAPEVVIVTNVEVRAPIPRTSVVFVPGGGPAILRDLSDKAVDHELSMLAEQGALDDLRDGRASRVHREHRVSPPYKVVVGEHRVEIHGFDITGDVAPHRTRQSPTMKLLVDEASGEPHAACLVGAMPTGDLWGAVFTSAAPSPHLVKISVSERNLKVINRLTLPSRRA